MPRIKEYYMLYKKSKTSYNRIAEVFPNNWGKEELEFVIVGYKFR